MGSLRQPIWPYTHQLAELCSLGFHQGGNTVVHLYDNTTETIDSTVTCTCMSVMLIICFHVTFNSFSVFYIFNNKTRTYQSKDHDNRTGHGGTEAQILNFSQTFLCVCIRLCKHACYFLYLKCNFLSLECVQCLLLPPEVAPEDIISIKGEQVEIGSKQFTAPVNSTGYSPQELNKQWIDLKQEKDVMFLDSWEVKDAEKENKVC